MRFSIWISVSTFSNGVTIIRCDSWVSQQWSKNELTCRILTLRDLVPSILPSGKPDHLRLDRGAVQGELPTNEHVSARALLTTQTYKGKSALQLVSEEAKTQELH
jgi:hypothetical protein